MQRRTRPYRRTTKPTRRPALGRQIKHMDLTAVRLIGCAVLLGFVLLLRTFFPSATDTLRTQILPVMEEDFDYRGAIAAIGETLTGERSFIETLGEITVRAFGISSDDHVEVSAEPYSAVPAPRPVPVHPPIEDVIPIPTPPAVPDPAPALNERAEAVAVFLAAQAAFPDFGIPENVSTTYTTLPFDVTVPVEGFISSPFGFRHDPMRFDVRFHFGTDIAAYSGTPIVAFADGHVIHAQYLDSWGKLIVVDHGHGVITRYAHASHMYVVAGDVVAKGQAIGRVGATGSATGPHLHFELIIDDVFFNPEFFVTFE